MGTFGKVEIKVPRAPKIDAATESAIRKALRKGDRGMRKIAADLNVGVGTGRRVKAKLDAA